MTFRSGGIASGLDTNTLIAQLVSIESQPIRQLQSRQSAYQTQISKFGKLSSNLSDLKTSLEAIDTRDELLALKGASSDDSIVKLTASGEATPGNYSVTVSQLAKAEKDRSAAFASQLDAIKAGTLTVTVKDEDAVDITIDEGDTLLDVVEKINTSDANISASIVNDGTHAYMFLTALETGHEIGGTPDDAVVLSESYTGTTGTELGLTQTQTAQNALFTVDGLSVEKTSNTVNDVIQGVTLDILSETTAETPEVALTLTPDIDTVKERIQDFVDAYNKVHAFLRPELALDAKSSRIDKLAGDAVASRVQSSLRSIVSSSMSNPGSAYDSLASIGIRTSSSNDLTIDAEELKNALENDFLGVAQLFVKDTDGFADRIVGTVDDFVDPHDGAIKSRTDGIQTSIDMIDTQIESAQRRVDAYEKSLVRQFTSLELMVSQWQTQGNYLTSALG